MANKNETRTMHQWSQRERVLLFIGILLVGGALLNAFAIRPMKDRLTALNQQILLKQHVLENSLKLIAQKEVIQGEYREYMKYAHERVSEEEESAALLNEVEAIARESGVLLVDLKPAVVRKIDFYTEYHVEVKVESDMSQLITFMHHLQNSESILRVVKFSISFKTQNVITTDLTVTRVVIS